MSSQELELSIANAKQNITLLRRQLQTGRIDPRYFDQRLESLENLLNALEADRRNTREQQRFAALYEVSKVIGSSLNLQTVLDQVMDAIIQLTGAERGFLMLLDDDGNLNVKVARDFDQSTLPSDEIAFSRTITRQVFETGEGVLTTNAQEDPRYAGQASIIAHSMRSIMAAPLRARGTTIGVVYVDNRIRAGLFGEDDLQALQAFATQAAVAIENARLYSETDAQLQARIEELQILQWIDRQLNASLDSERTIQILLEWATRLGKADASSLAMLNDEGQIQVTATYGEGSIFEVGQILEPTMPLVQRALEVEDAVLDVDPQQQQALLCIPIRFENAVIALMFFSAQRPDAFSEEEQTILSRVAGRAATALQNGRLYSAVKAADRAKTEFVSVVAHELKVPMTSIQGYASMLKAVGSLNEQQQQFVQTVLNNVERMKILVNDLSDISRIESGQLKIETQDVELYSVIAQAKDAVMAQIEERGHRFIEEIPPQLPKVKADPARLVQVLVNLLSNAYKYTPDNGTITLKVWTENDMVYISVQDTGVGMSPEQLAKLGT